MARLLSMAKACDKNQVDDYKRLVSQNIFQSVDINKDVLINQLESRHKYFSTRSTCINIACQYSGFHILESLLKNGARFDFPDSNKDTPLHNICRSDIDVNLKAERLLLMNHSHTASRI